MRAAGWQAGRTTGLVPARCIDTKRGGLGLGALSLRTLAANGCLTRERARTKGWPLGEGSARHRSIAEAGGSTQAPLGHTEARGRAGCPRGQHCELRNIGWDHRPQPTQRRAPRPCGPAAPAPRGGPARRAPQGAPAPQAGQWEPQAATPRWPGWVRARQPREHWGQGEALATRTSRQVCTTQRQPPSERGQQERWRR